MINEINKSWGWKGFEAVELKDLNLFGNIIFIDSNGGYWRICPEEVSCNLIANSEEELKGLFTDPEFRKDWEMEVLVEVAKSQAGSLEGGQCYCLKLPAVLGGLYEASNMGKISMMELIGFSGVLGFQIRDLKDGDSIQLSLD